MKATTECRVTTQNVITGVSPCRSEFCPRRDNVLFTVDKVFLSPSASGFVPPVKQSHALVITTEHRLETSHKHTEREVQMHLRLPTRSRLCISV